MKRILPVLTVFALGVGTLLTVTQCSSNNTLAPFQPEIVSTADNFQLQATGVSDRTATLNYSWSNSGTQATVNHSTTTTAGSARVVIKDADGTTVYDSALSASLNETTSAGTTGTWTIQLILSHYSGSLNFRVQKV